MHKTSAHIPGNLCLVGIYATAIYSLFMGNDASIFTWMLFIIAIIIYTVSYVVIDVMGILIHEYKQGDYSKLNNVLYTIYFMLALPVVLLGAALFIKRKGRK